METNRDRSRADHVGRRNRHPVFLQPAYLTSSPARSGGRQRFAAPDNRQRTVQDTFRAPRERSPESRARLPTSAEFAEALQWSLFEETTFGGGMSHTIMRERVFPTPAT